MFECVMRLFDGKESIREIGECAYNTVINMWNADEAADRVIRLFETLKLQGLNSAHELFSEGPCSTAEIFSDEWEKPVYGNVERQ